MKIKGIISLTLCACITVNTTFSPIYAVNTPTEEESRASQNNSDIVNAASFTAVEVNTVNDLLAQSKFTALQGHGFAAERGNNLIDNIKGNNAKVIGDNNVKNGADRLILNRDGTKILIQDKYYATAKGSINACFDEYGQFRYMDADGNPMQIEVPKDQYADAVEVMKKKILEGKIKGITDPEEANTLVREGELTYKQAKNLAKAGNIDSLKYDAANGAVTAVCSMGISAVINYAVCRINGDDHNEAAKMAAKEGLKTGGAVFCSSVIAGQLTKTGLMKVFEPSSEALVKALGDDFAKALLTATGKDAATAAAEASSKSLTQQAARALRAQALTAVVTTVVFSVPDAIDLFNGRISKKQFVKNFAVTAVSVAAGTAGYIAGGAVGNLIVPGVGTIPGGIVGSLLIGGLSGFAADKIADYITDDDADEMYDIVKDSFAQKCEDYLVNESEAQNIVDCFDDMLTEDMFKDMYQSDDRESFIDEKLTPLFENEISKRPEYVTPTDEEMRTILKDDLQGVVFIH